LHFQASAQNSFFPRLGTVVDTARRAERFAAEGLQSAFAQ
jgi:hypothetical protein